MKKIKAILIDIARKNVFLRKILLGIRMFFLKTNYMFFYRKYKVDPKLCVFESFNGRKYCDSPKSVYLEMLSDPKYKDYILYGDNPCILLEYLSLDEIFIIMRLLLFEQKILLVGNNYDLIAQIAFNFYRLLYPFQWVHTLIPIMTQKMTKYLDSFLPFFNGMHISLYELVTGTLEEIEENIFIFNINKHTFEMNTYMNWNSRSIVKKINEDTSYIENI